MPAPQQEDNKQTHPTIGQGPADATQQTTTESPIGDRPNVEDRKDGLRILLVDDCRMNRKVVAHILKRKLGCAADTACNGNEALQALKHKEYDLVLMDCQMPEMDGYETTRTVRDPGSDVLDHNTRIVALTANAMKGDREKCLEAGMDDYITKPITPDDLVAAVERNLPWHDLTQTQAGRSTGRSPEAVTSRQADDPELASLLDDFVKNLPGKLAAMREALANDRYDDLQRIAHQLKAADAGYGYHGLTEAARGVENAAGARCRESALPAMAMLSTLCQAVEAGHKARIAARKTQP